MLYFKLILFYMVYTTGDQYYNFYVFSIFLCTLIFRNKQILKCGRVILPFSVSENECIIVTMKI